MQSKKNKKLFFNQAICPAYGKEALSKDFSFSPLLHTPQCGATIIGFTFPMYQHRWHLAGTAS